VIRQLAWTSYIACRQVVYGLPISRENSQIPSAVPFSIWMLSFHVLDGRHTRDIKQCIQSLLNIRPILTNHVSNHTHAKLGIIPKHGAQELLCLFHTILAGTRPAISLLIPTLPRIWRAHRGSSRPGVVLANDVRDHASRGNRNPLGPPTSLPSTRSTARREIRWRRRLRGRLRGLRRLRVLRGAQDTSRQEGVPAGLAVGGLDLVDGGAGEGVEQPREVPPLLPRDRGGGGGPRRREGEEG